MLQMTSLKQQFTRSSFSYNKSLSRQKFPDCSAVTEGQALKCFHTPITKFCYALLQGLCFSRRHSKTETENPTKPITSAYGTMATTVICYYQCHATVKTGLVSDYRGARVITVYISNTVFGCMHYITIHTQWHSVLLSHQNYVILHTTMKSWYHCTKYHLAVLW